MVLLYGNIRGGHFRQNSDIPMVVIVNVIVIVIVIVIVNVIVNVIVIVIVIVFVIVNGIVNVIVIVIVIVNVIALSSILLYGKTVCCFCMVISEVGTSNRIQILR
jgi:hypothetical protein